MHHAITFLSHEEMIISFTEIAFVAGLLYWFALLSVSVVLSIPFRRYFFVAQASAASCVRKPNFRANKGLCPLK